MTGKNCIEYQPIPGWFDLSKLNLPKKKFKAYAELQRLGQLYQETYDYQKTHNSVQLEKLKELCAVMQLDLILHYNALEADE